MRLIIEPDYERMSKWAANYVAKCINEAKPTADKPFKLGCPTGSSPLGMYRELIALNKAGKVSFQNVITFNMDEYVNLPQQHPHAIIVCDEDATDELKHGTYKYFKDIEKDNLL